MAVCSATLQVFQMYAYVNEKKNLCWVHWAQEVGFKVSHAKCNYLKKPGSIHLIIGAAVQETEKAFAHCTSYTCVFHPALTASCLIKGIFGTLLHVSLIILKQKFYAKWIISL